MRAQLWSSDLAVSVLIFFSAFAVIMFSWNYVIVQNAEQAGVREMEVLALAISDQIIRIPGLPENWNSSNIDVLGLASEENILDDSKIEEFLGLDYQRAKGLLGIGIYEFQLQVKHLNNSIAQTLLGTEISYGLTPSDARVIVPVERYTMLNNGIVKLDLILWAGF